jgi:acetyl esterase/lipase
VDSLEKPMSRDRIDPQSLPGLDALLQAFPGGLSAIADVGERREALRRFLEAAKAGLPANDRVVAEDIAAPRAGAAGDVPLRIFRPAASVEALPCIFYIHGGGMLLGSIDDDALLCAMLSEALQVTVVALAYRLAPENPYPAALEDCVHSLRWLMDSARQLRICPDAVAIYGGSAGGNLAIATALFLRDHGGPALRLVAAPYPMLDDRNTTPSSREITDPGVWNRDANREAWDYYLAGRAPDAYAAPARAQDLQGLPPLFMDVGEVDLFRDETIEFAARLLRAGVPTELHVYPGAYHGSEIFAPDAPLSARIWARRIEALQSALIHR